MLERYELLHEAGLTREAERARQSGEGGEATVAGRSMALDHRRILATALGRLRRAIQERPVIFELLPETFTLLQLQRVTEAVAGVNLHKQNFRRLVDRLGLVEGTGALDTTQKGRPAELFRFRADVLRQQGEIGLGLPRVD